MVFCHSFFLFFLKFKKSTKPATEMVGLLASNASHSITLLQLVEYYNLKKQKMKYRGISAVINQDHGVSILERRLKYICKKQGLSGKKCKWWNLERYDNKWVRNILIALRVQKNDRNTCGQNVVLELWC